MSVNFENHLCYFCDVPYPYPSCFIINYNDLWVCYGCDYILINYNNKENDICCVCCEETTLYQLPYCNHKLCVKCCKTIFFGSATNEKPNHWREMTIDFPDYPYEINDDDENDPETIRYNEYCEYEKKYFDYEKTYDELIEIRNSLIAERPDWMNTEAFINYENGMFIYHTEFQKLDKEWERYEKNKIIGNKSCPLCRATYR